MRTLFALALLTLIPTGGSWPVQDHNFPAGSLALANLPTRVGWFEDPPFGGGRWHFQYRGDAAGFHDALARFSHINAPNLELFVHPGVGASDFLENKTFDWEFVVWDPQSFHHLFNDPQSIFECDQPEFRRADPPTRLDVYVGRIDWTLVHVPAGITVTDLRASSAGYGPQDGSVVRGSVYDMLTSKPLPNMKVVVEKFNPQKNAYDPVATGVSDAAGGYEIRQVPPGGFRVVFRLDGYVSRSTNWMSLDAAGLANVTTRLLPSETISGVVADSTGKPLPGVTVQPQAIVGFDGRGYTLPEPPTTKTDADGRFSLNGMPRGFAQVGARAAGYFQADLLDLHAIPSDHADLHLVATGTVRGRVQGRGNGIVNLRFVGEQIGHYSGSMNLKPDGSFEFDNVPPGQYLIGTDPMLGIKPEADAKSITVTSGNTIDVELPGP